VAPTVLCGKARREAWPGNDRRDLATPPAASKAREQIVKLACTRKRRSQARILSEVAFAWVVAVPAAGQLEVRRPEMTAPVAITAPNT
jgi:hypothetical protein